MSMTRSAFAFLRAKLAKFFRQGVEQRSLDCEHREFQWRSFVSSLMAVDERLRSNPRLVASYYSPPRNAKEARKVLKANISNELDSQGWSQEQSIKISRAFFAWKKIAG